MYLSKYNIIKKKGDIFFIYNTFSGAIASLNDYEYKLLMKADNSNISSFNVKEQNLIREFLKGAYIEEERMEQINKLRFESYYSRYFEGNLSLTIAPTTSCNFRCPYCYEKGIKYHTMTDEVINDTIEFINSKESRMINICWYGGEPLLNIDIIEKITKGINKGNVNIKHSMVTNGYLLRGSTLQKVKDLGINDIQITVDGTQEIHDSRRFLYNGGKTFDTIIENITNACEYMKISLRVNVDMTNVNYVDDLMEYLKEKNIFDKIHIYLAPVDNINETQKDSRNLYINNKVDFFSEKQKDFLEKNLDEISRVSFFEERSPYLCGAVSMHSFLIDPLGDIYNCWNDIGRKSYAVGNVREGVESINELYKWLSYDPFSDQECLNCNIFPICLNGCPHSVIRKNKKICNTNKNSYKDLLGKFV